MTQHDDAETIYVASDGSATDRLASASKLLPRRRFFNDMPDKGLFAFVSVAGFAGILLLKLNSFDANYVAAGAVLLMFAYGFVAYQFPKVQMRLDRLGDNFYYLGFLFTLASLSAALIQLQKGALINDLLGSFGIALFTTIVGVAGRVLFVQMRGDLEEVEDQVRQDLLLASSDLRAQLALALTEFETFHTGVRQAAQLSIDQGPASANEAISRIQDVAAAAADNIDRAFAVEKSKVQDLGDAVVRITHLLEDFTGNLNDRMDEFGEQLRTMLAKLSETVDRIDGQGTKRRWYWPFRAR